MPKLRTEEQFPLLLFIVGSGDEELSKTNRRFFGKNRFDGITSGASAVITEWPNYLSSCWVTSLICGLCLFLMTLMLTASLSTQYHHRLPRCAHNNANELNNRTIHLVHNSHKWSPKQLDFIQNITEAFPDYKIHIIIMKNSYLMFKKTKKADNNDTVARSIFMKALVGDNIDGLLSKHPNVITVTYRNYNEIFENTPLFLNWVMLSDPMRVFAVRVLQLWQFGGLSFELNSSEGVLLKMVQGGAGRFANLSMGMVSVDWQGLHMETKTACHAFFGKVLVKLRSANLNSMPISVLKGPLYTFCRAGVVEKKYCNMVTL